MFRYFVRVKRMDECKHVRRTIRCKGIDETAGEIYEDMLQQRISRIEIIQELCMLVSGALNVRQYSSPDNQRGNGEMVCHFIE